MNANMMLFINVLTAVSIAILIITVISLISKVLFGCFALTKCDVKVEIQPEMSIIFVCALIIALRFLLL